MRMLATANNPIGVVVELDEACPQMTQMGRSEARQMLTVVRRLCGQPATSPSEVFDQSIVRIKLPISPPPDRKASESEPEGNLSPGNFMSGF